MMRKSTNLTTTAEQRKGSRASSKRPSVVSKKDDESGEDGSNVEAKEQQKKQPVKGPPYCPPPANYIVLMFGGFITKLVNMKCRKGIFDDFLKKNVGIPPGCVVDLCDMSGRLVGLPGVEGKEPITDLFQPASTYVPCVLCRDGTETGVLSEILPCLASAWMKEEPQLQVGFQKEIDASKAEFAEREAKRLEEQKRLEKEERDREKKREKEAKENK